MLRRADKQNRRYFSFGARALYSINVVSLSLAGHITKGLDKIDDGSKKKNTGIVLYSIVPQIGFSVPKIPFLQLVHLSYTAPLASENLVFTDYARR